MGIMIFTASWPLILLLWQALMRRGFAEVFWTWAKGRAFPESFALKYETLRDFFVSRFESCCLVLFCIYNHLLAVLAANEHMEFTKMCELF